MKRISLITTLLIFVTTFLQAQHDLTSDQTDKIDAFINHTMEKLGIVPGLGLAIVLGDEIIYSQGYGMRDAWKERPVTEETGFYIASVTKNFTGLLCAMLEENGKIELSAPLSDYLTQDWYFTPNTLKENSIIDLLTHTTSFADNGIAYRSAFLEEVPWETTERILFDIGGQQEKSFRYSNAGYNITTSIIKNKYGTDWRDLLSTEILDPLGLENTTAYMSEAVKREIAQPYTWLNGKFVELPLKADGQMQSSGGVVSTPNDLGRWLICHMNNGMVDSVQVFPPEVMQRANTAYTTLEKTYYKFKRSAYRLGWYQSGYNGEEVIHHFGGFSGYSAHLSYMPDYNFGVVALTNESDYGSMVPHMVATYIYDLYLGKEDIDEAYEDEIDEMLENLEDKMAKNEARIKMKRDLISDTDVKDWGFDPVSLEGQYFNPRLGLLTVDVSDDQPTASLGVHDEVLVYAGEDKVAVDWQQTGYFSPPTVFNVVRSDDEGGEVIGLDWGGRPFRKLKEGISIDDVLNFYPRFNEQLKSITSMEGEARVKSLLVLCQEGVALGALTESYVNNLGYKHLNHEDFEMAADFFKVNTGLYPTSPNTYDSAGECMELAGNAEEAILYYTRAVMIATYNEDPNLEIYQENFDRVKFSKQEDAD